MWVHPLPLFFLLFFLGGGSGSSFDSKLCFLGGGSGSSSDSESYDAHKFNELLECISDVFRLSSTERLSSFAPLLQSAQGGRKLTCGECGCLCYIG